MNIGNQQFDGRYLFAGSDTTVTPFTTTAGGLIQYNGNNRNINSFSNANLMFPTNVTGAAAFSAACPARSRAPISTPKLTADTPLADLPRRGGRRPGQHRNLRRLLPTDRHRPQPGADRRRRRHDDRGQSARRPQRASRHRPLGPERQSCPRRRQVHHAVDQRHRQRPDREATGNRRRAAPTARSSAAPLNPTISLTTPLSALNGGGGIDQTSGLQIVGNGKTQDVSLAGCQTIQDVINALNSSGTGLVAQINSSGTGLEVYSNLSGCDFSIGENGGQTATDLGLRTLSANTPLSDLNYGAGVAAAQGDSQSFTVAAADGTVVRRERRRPLHRRPGHRRDRQPMRRKSVCRVRLDRQRHPIDRRYGFRRIGHRHGRSQQHRGRRSRPDSQRANDRHIRREDVRQRDGKLGASEQQPAHSVQNGGMEGQLAGRF